VHFRARCLADQAELTWDVSEPGDVHWRVLRSEKQYADQADVLSDGTQTTVMDGPDTCLVDRVEEGKTYYYTVFAQDQHSTWHRQVKVKLTSRDDLSWWQRRSRDQSSLTGDLLLEACDGRPIDHMPVIGAGNPLQSH